MDTDEKLEPGRYPSSDDPSWLTVSLPYLELLKEPRTRTWLRNWCKSRRKQSGMMEQALDWLEMRGDIVRVEVPGGKAFVIKASAPPPVLLASLVLVPVPPAAPEPQDEDPEEEMPPAPKLYTTKEAAKYLNIHPVTLNKMRREGKIAGEERETDRGFVYSQVDLDEFKAKKELMETRYPPPVKASRLIETTPRSVAETNERLAVLANARSPDNDELMRRVRLVVSCRRSEILTVAKAFEKICEIIKVN